MKKGFVFIETIIVVCILTVGLISIYANYSKIIANTKELNTFDTAEYNYKTYFLKQKYPDITENTCIIITSPFSDTGSVKICNLKNVFYKKDYLNTEGAYPGYIDIDAYIIDYLNTQDWNKHNDNIYLVEYKKADKENSGEYLTYISSLSY